jgi:hypothetical protein
MKEVSFDAHRAHVGIEQAPPFRQFDIVHDLNADAAPIEDFHLRDLDVPNRVGPGRRRDHDAFLLDVTLRDIARRAFEPKTRDEDIVAADHK